MKFTKIGGDKVKDITAEIISWVKTIVFAVLFALCINNLVIVNASVPTGSMENNIMTDDRIIAFRLAYLFSDPERFDIVVFKYPDDESTLYVKRVIGLPGDTVEIKNGNVYINGSEEALNNSFIKEPQEVEKDMIFVVPEDHYFMMGDNRNGSWDSRYWVNNKYVNKDKILGEVVCRYFPNFKIFSDIETN